MEIKALKGKITLKGVQEKTGRGKEINGEEEKEVIAIEEEGDTGKGELVYTKRDGACLYHFLSCIEEIQKKEKKVGELEYTRKKMEGAKAQIIHNVVSFYESAKADGDERAKNSWQQRNLWKQLERILVSFSIGSRQEGWGKGGREGKGGT